MNQTKFYLKPTKNNPKALSKGEWFFTLVSGNGKVVAQSEVYQSKTSALNGITAVKAAAIDAQTIILRENK